MIFKSEVVEHTYTNGVPLTFTKHLLSVTVHYNRILIGKRYLDTLWTIHPSKVLPIVFSKSDDRCIKQIVNETFDGAL